mmetsp:Transcript_6647/g.15208  ORF Transcript_6647/g.15208 Transcript_6647/m.15208 type:complete len:281 (-) Transcript_6647:65-907(-)
MAGVQIDDPRNCLEKVDVVAFGDDTSCEAVWKANFLSPTAKHENENATFDVDGWKFSSVVDAFQGLRSPKDIDVSSLGPTAGQAESEGYENDFVILLAVLRAKFASNVTFRDLLLSTKDSFLIYHASASSQDGRWSNNLNGHGYNLFGLALMMVRDEVGGTSGSPGSWTSWLIENGLDVRTGEGLEAKANGQKYPSSRWTVAVGLASSAIRKKLRVPDAQIQVPVQAAAGQGCLIVACKGLRRLLRSISVWIHMGASHFEVRLFVVVLLILVVRTLLKRR